MKLYHVSINPDLKVLVPRVPKNEYTFTGIEDNVHKRICFAPSIQQALRAFARPINKETLYVYTPKVSRNVSNEERNSASIATSEEKEKKY